MASMLGASMGTLPLWPAILHNFFLLFIITELKLLRIVHFFMEAYNKESPGRMRMIVLGESKALCHPNKGLG
jgi:hypothetical protein